MHHQTNRLYSAFAGTKRIATGPIEVVAKAAKMSADNNTDTNVLVFDKTTGKVVDLNLRGTIEEVVGRYSSSSTGNEDKKVGPGRPRLGVVPREVTLLPRHWEWLATQPGGASTTLRRLVEEAKKNGGAKDAIRQAQAATYESMRVLAGDLPDYENALRSLYAGDKLRFQDLIDAWPSDIREHLLELAGPAFATNDE